MVNFKTVRWEAVEMIGSVFYCPVYVQSMSSGDHDDDDDDWEDDEWEDDDDDDDDFEDEFEDS